MMRVGINVAAYQISTLDKVSIFPLFCLLILIGERYVDECASESDHLNHRGVINLK
jgi:hypothetical protein